MTSDNCLCYKRYAQSNMRQQRTASREPTHDDDLDHPLGARPQAHRRDRLDPDHAGRASRRSGLSTGAFSKKFSVPGREGFTTNDKIVRIYHQGGRYAPLVPVVTLPAGESVASPAVRGRASSRSRRSCARRSRAREPRRSPRPATARSSRPMAARRSCSPIRRRTTSRFGNNTKAAKTAAACSPVSPIAGAPVHVTGLRRAPEPDRRLRRPRRAARGDARRPRRAGRARVRVRVAATRSSRS